MTTESKNKPQSFVSRNRLLFGIAVLVIGLGLFVLLRSHNRPEDFTPLATFPARQGPLTISVTEAGTIRPREQIILKSEVEGQTVILFLVDEGTQVKKGDLLVELDASQLLDQRLNQQIQMINAEAAFVSARENLSVVKSQAQADVDKAVLDLDFAHQDLEQYQAGEFPKLEKEARAAITLAEETLTNAGNTYEWSKKLFAEKYLSEAELKKDELSWRKAEIDLDLARDSLNLLQNFTYKRRLAELESTLRQAQMALERARRKASADVVQADAKLKANDAEYRKQQDKFRKIEEQIKKTKIYAPMDGTVIYATSTRISWRSNSEPLDEGQAVRERQELIYLPTTLSYNAEIKIHESSLEKISPGLPVRIKIDALPGRELTGRVASIAPLPDATSMFMNPDLKVYNSLITIDGDGSFLRNGMSCQAEIIIDHFTDTLYVPLQAVVRIGNQSTVYLADGNRLLPRPVNIGLDNNRMVQILKGLEVGEHVVLTPPLADAAKPLTGMNNGTPPPSSKGEGSAGNSEQLSRSPRDMTPAQREAFKKQRQNRPGQQGQP